MVLCDTDIFVEALKNNKSVTGLLRHIGFQNIALSAITLMELYQSYRTGYRINKSQEQT